jgi:hypothetical protein
MAVAAYRLGSSGCRPPLKLLSFPIRVELAICVLAIRALGWGPTAAVQTQFFDGGAAAEVFDGGGAGLVLDGVFHLVGVSF